MARDASAFNADTTADEVLEDLDLSDMVVLITGASSGLGAESARAMAAKGAMVVVTARQIDKARGVAEEIRGETGNADVYVMALELTDLASVRAFAAAFLERHGHLDVLINNAGVMACPLTRTTAGYELQFATNHLGHFLLSELLLPALRAGAPSRIVAVSSAGHRLSPVLFDDVHFHSTVYDKWTAYGQSKTANVLHAVELDRRLRDDGVRALAIHPGAIVTELGRHLEMDDLTALNARSPGGKLEFKPVAAGAATQVFAATAPELEGRGGVYLEDCAIAAVDDGEGNRGVRSYALDPENAARLWDVSRSMVA
jgi:NAD(P)-dependent dehydrogenase (short-subunit alcohol dehydrogenase family)